MVEDASCKEREIRIGADNHAVAGEGEHVPGIVAGVPNEHMAGGGLLLHLTMRPQVAPPVVSEQPRSAA